jgi:molybdopterin synthase catalytic subunit
MLLSIMYVTVIAFGILKDWLGSSGAAVELPGGATVADLLNRLRTTSPADAPVAALRGIAVSVNAEYAERTKILQDGDEVGLLPPVSGGVANRPGTGDPQSASGSEANARDGTHVLSVALTRAPINAETILASAKRAEDGAVVVFDGIVRNHSRGRRTLHLDYEAYEEMAVKQMQDLGQRARERFGVRQVTMVHRLGRLEIGETSVLIVVASAHRGAAFEACRWLIDTLKQTVPIWKRETFVDGVVWAPGEPFPEALAIDTSEGPHDA